MTLPVDQARSQLLELLTILGEVRNAGPRDQRFKHWRQITTTALQRIWSDEPARAERFRRILFSGPTAMPDPRATREHFERGCREAGAYLTALIRELGEEGDAPAAPPAVAATSGVPETPSAAPAPPAASAEPKPSAGPLRRPAPKTTPTGTRRPPPPPPPSPRSAATGLPSAPAAPRPGAAATGPATVPPAPPLRAPRSAATGLPTPPAPTPKSASGAPAASGHLPATSRLPAQPAPTPPAPEAARPPAEPDPAAERPGAESPASEPPTGGSELRDMLGLLGSSEAEAPATPRRAPPEPSSEVLRPFVLHPVRPSRPPEPAVAPASGAAAPPRPAAPVPPASAALELLALAARLGDLEVPERQRPVVRATLVDLWRQIESPPVSWETLRAAVTLVLEHPALARRVLPLIVPHLDRAA